MLATSANAFNKGDYLTYLGGSAWDFGAGVAVDTEGSVYVTGSTLSTDFPATPGAFAAIGDGDIDQGDAYVAKLRPDGSGLVYATYLGGTGSDRGIAIAVDAQGSAYVTGQTHSADFPVTPGAFDTTYNSGEGDAFVAKLSPDGSTLEYSTYVGGTDWDGNELAQAIAVDPHGSAYVTGRTLAPNFPITPGAFDATITSQGEYPDAFVSKLTPAGSGLEYSTYLGGAGDDSGLGIAVDTRGNAHVTGYTASLDFPTTAAAFDTRLEGDREGAPGAAFVTKLNPGGTDVAYSTYLGGTGGGFGTGIALGPGGSAYVGGRTGSTDFPTTAGALDRTFDPACSQYGSQSFVTKLTSGGNRLAYSTYLDEPACDLGDGIAVDASGSAYVSGTLAVRRLNPAGSRVTYARSLISSHPTHLAVDKDGAAYVSGVAGMRASGPTPPATPGAFDTSLDDGTSDAFVAKLVICPPKRHHGCKPPKR